jgi:hypothetical protein
MRMLVVRLLAGQQESGHSSLQRPLTTYNKTSVRGLHVQPHAQRVVASASSFRGLREVY